MKLTLEQVESKMAKVWGNPVDVVPYRICGNRYSYVVTDHGEQWMSLDTSWEGGRQVFEPSKGSWPAPSTWQEAVAEAAELARAYLGRENNQAALARLPDAVILAEARRWTKLGDAQDTWLMLSSRSGKMYEVNGECACPDVAARGWCEHRLARALARRAEKLMGEANASQSAPSPSAPTKAQQIELIVAYEADEARVLARMGAGQLVQFKADGQEMEPPTRSLFELYRWLQAEGYVPSGFKWLGWEHGLRQRRQTYTLSSLPVQVGQNGTESQKE
jgi:hypothetical protein